MAAAGAGLAGGWCWPGRGPDGFTQGSTARVVSWPAVGCTWRPRWWPFPVRGTGVLSGGGFGSRASGDEDGLSRYGMRPGASWLLRRGCRAVSSSLVRSGTRFDHCASGREVNQPGTHAPGEAVRGRHLQLGHAPGAEGATFPRENATRQGNMMTFEVACRAGAMRPQETAAWYGHSALAPSAHGGRPRDSGSGHRPASAPRRYVPPGAPPRRGPSSRAP